MIEDTGINRNIMECKVSMLTLILCKIICINRNIMECKARKRGKEICQSFVLIETLWNVKLTMNLTTNRPSLCINRNIMECKVKQAMMDALRESVLIETLWNVKLIELYH